MATKKFYYTDLPIQIQKDMEKDLTAILTHFTTSTVIDELEIQDGFSEVSAELVRLGWRLHRKDRRKSLYVPEKEIA